MKKGKFFKYLAGGVILALESYILTHAGITPFMFQWWAIMLLTIFYSFIVFITCIGED